MPIKKRGEDLLGDSKRKFCLALLKNNFGEQWSG